jgi:hypothetical protein
MITCVQTVFPWSQVLKISIPVVGFDCVNMVDLFPFWTRADESERDHNIDALGLSAISLMQCHLKIASPFG